MHEQAERWVRDHVTGKQFDLVIELGSCDVNGGIKHLFDCEEYVGVDVVPGPNVDIVSDAALFRPQRLAACVVTTEMLEHAENAREICIAAIDMLEPGGMFIATAAGPGRAPHSAIDGRAVRAGEYYGNIDPNELTSWLVEAGFVEYIVDRQRRPADVRCVAYKPGTEHGASH